MNEVAVGALTSRASSMQTMIRIAAAAFFLCTVGATQEPQAMGTLTGQVVDALGDPVPVAEVWVGKSPELDPRPPTTRTDGDGLFVVRVPYGDPFVRAWATAPNRASAYGAARVTAASPQGHAHIRLWDAGKIRGRVVDTDGRPVGGAYVAASGPLRGPSMTAKTRSDEKGRFELTNVALGRTGVQAWNNGFRLSREQLWLRDEADVEIVLERGDEVSLTVRADGLDENVSARIHLSSSALMDPLNYGTIRGSQSWKATGLPDQSFRIYISADGYVFQPEMMRTESGAPTHDVVFKAMREESVEITGVLRDVEGRPLGGETLLCRMASGGRRKTATTDVEGRFRMESPQSPGTELLMFLSGSDYVIAQKKSKDMRGRSQAYYLRCHEFTIQEKTHVELRAAPAAIVGGRLVADDDRLVRWVRLILEWRGGLAHTNSDREGRFLFRGIMPPVPTEHRDTELRVVGRDGECASEPFTLAVGEVVKGMEIRMSPVGIIEGTVTDANGKPVPGARIQLRAHENEIMTSREGRFRIPDVQPGEHRLFVRIKDIRSQFDGGTFEVRPGETVRLPVKLEQEL